MSNKSLIICYFGRLSKEKGIKTLIYAVEKLDVKIDLKIVGTGVLEIELKNIFMTKTTNIKLLGFKKEKSYKLIRIKICYSAFTMV